MFDRFCMRDALSKKHRERALRKNEERENIERDSMIASSTRRCFFQSARAFVLLIPIPRSLCFMVYSNFHSTVENHIAINRSARVRNKKTRGQKKAIQCSNASSPGAAVSRDLEKRTIPRIAIQIKRCVTPITHQNEIKRTTILHRT